MKKSILNLLPLISLVSVLTSCEKVIDVQVPDNGSSIVIEGSIESDGFPLILITKSESYFDPISTSAEALANVLVDSAQVFITVDSVESEILKFCLDDLPPELQELAEDFLGFESIPEGLDICAWANPLLIGVEGKTYGLRVVHDGEEYKATTTIPKKLNLDSIWFKLQPPNEGQGFIWCTMNDPDTIGNSYRMFAERIGVDNGPIPVPGASWDDRFFNGEKFDFNFARGSRFGVEENEDSVFFFATGDLVAVKLTTTDLAVHEFWESADDAIAGGQNPFVTPSQIESNFDNGARGVWAGYGVARDTIECIPLQ